MARCLIPLPFRAPVLKLCLPALVTYVVIFVASTIFLSELGSKWKSTSESDDPRLVQTKLDLNAAKKHASSPAHRRKPAKRYITVQTDSGRLGNKLFQYASMYGVALRYNFIAVLKDDESLLSYVNKSKLRAFTVSSASWNKVQWHVWSEPHASSYDKHALLSGLRAKGSILLERYLQSFRYFEGYEANVVSQFVFSQAVRDWSNAAVRKVVARMPRDGQKSTIVGVHIRRGDYLNDDSKTAGYNTPGEDYYVRAVRYFKKRHSFVAFVVSSDDIEWARSLFVRKFESKATYRRSTVFEYLRGTEAEPEKALATLSLANHSILSAGSYSFWSAMLRQYRTGTSDGGTTVYYTKPFVVGTRIGDAYENSTENYYPPDWIGLD